jgi:hypothetical protein
MAWHARAVPGLFGSLADAGRRGGDNLFTSSLHCLDMSQRGIAYKVVR